MKVRQVPPKDKQFIMNCDIKSIEQFLHVPKHGGYQPPLTKLFQCLFDNDTMEEKLKVTAPFYYYIFYL